MKTCRVLTRNPSIGLRAAARAALGVLVVALGAAASAAATPADDIRDAVGKRRALIVHVGAGTGDLAKELAAGTDHVIHGLEPDAAKVAEAREKSFGPAGQWGRVLLEAGPVDVLPYVGNLANVVVVDDFRRLSGAGLTAREVVRVLATDGLGIIGQSARLPGQASAQEIRDWLAKAAVADTRVIEKDGLYLAFRKKRPEGMDEWTHKWHDATRNSASQDKFVTGLRALQWIGSDPYTWQMRHGRTAGNRVVLVYDNNAGMSRWGTYKEDAVTFEVFDAHSGVLQWKRKYAPGFRLGFDPVVTGDRIITPVGKELQALDANTGDTALVYADAGDVRGGVVADSVLVVMEPQAVKGLDLGTGRGLWTYESKVPYEVNRGKRGSSQVSGMDSYCIPAGGGLAFITEKAKDGSQRIFGLDLKTGEEKWTYSDASMGEVYPRHWYYEGRLMVSAKNGLYGLPVKSASREVWHVPVTNFDRKTGSLAGTGLKDAYKNYFGVNSLVWGREGSQAGLLFTDRPDAKPPAFAKTWVGYNVETGKEAKRVGYDVDGGWQQRCFPDQATPAFILSSNNEIVDLETGQISNYRALRGMCGEGPFYGNGLYYVPTHYCIFCYPMVRGTVAMTPEAPPATPVPDDRRLEKGPAYTEISNPKSEIPKADDWPMYRQNPQRTSGSKASVQWPPADAPAWKASFGERIVGPVIADGRVFVTVVNQGRIVALDASSGKTLWTFWAGPRIDLPPTVHGGQVLFGCHDGFVYALRASDGALAWRFSAAPERRRMVTCDRVESAWPVLGAVLVSDGALYCLAGRITRCDGGMHMYALDPVSGKMKWHRVLAGTHEPELATGIRCWKQEEGQMMNNLLEASGDELRLPDEHQVWQFSAASGDWMPRKAPPPSTQPNPTAAGGVNYYDWFGEGFPYLGFDRPTIGWIMHGLEPVAELRHPYESGTPCSFPDARSLGVLVKRVRKSNEGQFTVIIPCKPADIAAGWAEKDLPWKVRLMANENPNSDVYALACAGDAVYLACTSFVPPQEGGELRAFSLKDGQALGSVKLPVTPVYDGLAAAGGKLFISLRDGTLLCLAGK